ncbi:unnamed protein product [Arabidopsis halleri]
MASLLTSDSDYFTTIVTNKYGSKRVQKLLGKSDDVDALFCAAILRGMSLGISWWSRHCDSPRRCL